MLERRGSQKGGFPKRSGLEKKGSWKEVMKILAGIQNLEVGGDPGSQRAAWRQILGDVQGPWPVMPEAGDSKQLHSKN